MFTEKWFNQFLAHGVLWFALALFAVLSFRAFCSWSNSNDDRRVKKALREAKRGTTVKLRLTGTCGKDEESEWLLKAALLGFRMKIEVGGEVVIFPPYDWFCPEIRAQYFEEIKREIGLRKTQNELLRRVNQRLLKLNLLRPLTGSEETKRQLDIDALSSEKSILTILIQERGKNSQKKLADAIHEDKKIFASSVLLLKGVEVEGSEGGPRQRFLVRFEGGYYVVKLKEARPVIIFSSNPTNKRFTDNHYHNVSDVFTDFRNFEEAERERVRKDTERIE